MSAANDDLALPRGFRDILPTEARELHAIERTLMEAFERYGYVPLEPPSVEFARAASTVDERRMMRFLDQGNLLALRPDVTTALARVVAQRYREAQGALRLSYFTTVFRQDRSMRGSEREYDQAGVELIGPTGAVADAEILALLCDALTSLGLRSFTIEVGHMGAVRALFADLPAATVETVLERLRGSDLVGAFRVAADAGMPADRLEHARRTLAVRGRGIEALGDLACVRDLRETIHLARELFAGDPPLGVPDLGVIPALPYYTGIVFEVVSPHVGAPIATGGRYDELLARYGTDRAATGFGIAVPLLHQALVADGWKVSFDAPLVSLEGGDDAVRLRVAAALRGRGFAVALGGVAESAGRAIVRAEVVSAERVRIDGRELPLDAAARELSQAGPNR
ncbi:MAG: ATP phosphoribosyltransferase regulatory subunit [Chloroflexota bacterium]|nr:ATP phosphoribosyltransferase regulatory subunit [Chloroflexota bacterium]